MKNLCQLLMHRPAPDKIPTCQLSIARNPLSGAKRAPDKTLSWSDEKTEFVVYFWGCETEDKWIMGFARAVQAFYDA